MNGITLFSGGGGVECGMIGAGIRPVMAVEGDPSNWALSQAIADSHAINFPGCKLIRRSVQDVSRLRFPGFPTKIDFLHASPVCSNFSFAKKDREETQNDIDCADAVARAIILLEPRRFTLEQVPGYLLSRSWEIIVEVLKQEGYLVDVQVINFADYGLPQNRHRMIVRAAFKEFGKLKPQPKSNWCDAIADLIPQMPIAATLSAVQQKAIDSSQKNSPMILWRSSYGSAAIANEPAPTITCSIFKDGKGSSRNHFGDIWWPNRAIHQLSIESMARLQSFPDWYKFPNETAIAGSIIGYSVPPAIAQMIFESFT